jgi:hypothetical protein
MATKERTIYDDLAEEMSGNGEMDTATREKYTILMLKQIGRDISKIAALSDRVEKLERYSIILFCQRNPRTASIIGIVILVLINLWFFSGFRKAIFSFFGVPPELVP